MERFDDSRLGVGKYYKQNHNHMNQITLDKPRTLRFTYGVLMEVEKETGKNALNGLGDIGVGDAIVLAHYGMKNADPDYNLTIEEVGKLFKGKNFPEVFQAFTSDMEKLNSGIDEKK